ncbi:hypothetical protein DXZ75_08200 [Streptomyces sp. AcE210]|nr:hypothetical protein DXZ75_08200 [Streptomyces sp. AcE210]
MATMAALLWTWCAVLLLIPYQVDEEQGDRYPHECESLEARSHHPDICKGWAVASEVIRHAA